MLLLLKLKIWNVSFEVCKRFLMAVSQNGSVNIWSFGRSESTSVAKLLWPMLSCVQGNTRLCIWRQRTDISCVIGATGVGSRIRWLIGPLRHWSPESESHSIVSGNIYCSPGQGRVSAVCVLGDWRSSTLNCSTTVKSVVVIIISRRVRVKASEVQHRRKAVKIYVFRRPAASWGTSKPALLFLGG